MKKLDYYLQNERFRRARRYINPGDKILDIGSFNMEMFEQFDDLISYGIAIDPAIKEPGKHQKYEFIRGYFPLNCPSGIRFDVITMLAVMEHIKPEEQKTIADGCYEYLKPGGKIVLTIPSPMVDQILKVLIFFRVLDGIALEEHYG